jgi:integrase
MTADEALPFEEAKTKAIVDETSKTLTKLEQDISNLRRLAQVADVAAQHNIFGRHLFGKAHNTLRMYKAGLKTFTLFLEEYGVKLSYSLFDEPSLWEAISPGLVQAFQLWMLKHAYTLKTANDYLGVIKVFTGLAYDAHIIKEDIYLRIQRIERFSGMEAERIEKNRLDQKQPVRRGHKKPEAVYFEKEHLPLLQQFFDSIDQSTPQGLRDYVAILLLYELGLRPGEAIALLLSDLDLSRKRLHVNRYKTGIKQYLPLPDSLLSALDMYLPVRRDWELYRAHPSKQYDAPLLVQSLKNHQLIEACDLIALRKAEEEVAQSDPEKKKGRKRPLPESPDWSTQHLWDRVHQLSIAAGLPQALAPYDGRHQWTYEAVEAGTPYPIIQQAGGWKTKSQMVERYYGRHKNISDGVKLLRHKTSTSDENE